MRSLVAAMLILGGLLGCPQSTAKAPSGIAAAPTPLPKLTPADLVPVEPIPPGLTRTWSHLEGHGFRGPSDLKAFLDTPEASWGRSHAWVARAMGDWPTERAIWHRLAAADPTDVDAALHELEAQARDGDAASIAGINAVVDGTASGTQTWRGHLANLEAQQLQCSATWHLGDHGAAQKVCLANLRNTSSTAVLGTFTEISVSKSDGVISARTIEEATVHERRDPDLWFLDAAALQLGHHANEAHHALETALWLEPRHAPALRAYLSLDTNPAQWLAALTDWRTSEHTNGLVRCADALAALGLSARADVCLKALDARDAELGRLVRLQILSRTSPAAAADQLKALIGKTPPTSAPALVTAAAILMANADAAGALPLANHALERDATNLDAEDLVLAAGGHPAKPLPRAPTAHERSANAWIDDLVAVPPLVRRVVLTPYSDQPIPETQGLAEALHRTFPQVEFVLQDLQPPPASAIVKGRAIGEFLLARVPDEVGRIAVVTADVATQAGTYGYGTLDPFSSRAVVSVNRFRSPNGQPTDPTAPTPDIAVARARGRLVEEITSSLGKLMGMSHPCLQAKCALRAPLSIEQFDANGPELCSVHRDELKQIFVPLPPPAK